MSYDQPVIRLENVTQRFRVIHERPDTMRELFSKMFRHNSSFHDFEAVKNASLEVTKGKPWELSGVTDPAKVPC